MIAFHGALTTVNYVDHLRRHFEATQHQSVADDDRCTDDEVSETSTVEAARRWTIRARSLPLDNSETTCRRLVSRGTQTSLLARYVGATTDNEDTAWLRRIDAMDLSFPVSRQSELRGFLADTLALAVHGGDADRKQLSAVLKPRTPQMKRRRWAARDLCIDDGPTSAEDVDDQPLTVLDDDPDNWTDDENDNTVLSPVPVYSDSYCAMRPLIGQWTPGYSTTETRSYFRSGNRPLSRLPAPNMPMIREDEQASSADDEDAGDMSIPSPLPAEPAPSQGPPTKPSICGQMTHSSQRACMSAVDDEIARCCRHLVETPTIDDTQHVPPTCTSPSLLDAMHKKYCASQYVRRPAPSASPSCHGNAHLLGVVTRQKDAQSSAADDDCVNAAGNFITRQIDTTEHVNGNHVTSSHRGVCDSASDAAVGGVKAIDANATTTVDVTSSTQSTAGFEDEEVDDDDEEEEEENGELKDEQQRSESSTMCNDQPWKKRFCEHCHGELKVNQAMNLLSNYITLKVKVKVKVNVALYSALS